MQIRRAVALFLAMMVTYGCESSGTASLDTEDQKGSYAVGLDVGNSLKAAGDVLDRAALMRGIQDALDDADPALTPEEIQAALQSFSMSVQASQTAAREETAERNQVEGAAFLAENGAKEGVITTDSGLQYEVLREGDGPRPQPTDEVTVHYRGTLADGTQFDSSYDRGEPQTFSVGGVIPGFSEGLQLMTVGSHYRFAIPGDIAYGAGGRGEIIGPHATLIFEVELVEIPQ